MAVFVWARSRSVTYGRRISARLTTVNDSAFNIPNGGIITFSSLSTRHKFWSSTSLLWVERCRISKFASATNALNYTENDNQFPSKTWAGTATVWCYCVPVQYVGTSYTSASARDGILSGRRAGAHRTDYVVAISKTIVNSRFGRLACLCRPSTASQSVLMCPYETCTMPDHWKVGTMVWHCAGLIWTHISFKPRRRDGRGTTVSRIVNSWWSCSL